MNPGHTIFKRAQRLQGGTGNVLGPGELADLYAALLKQGEHRRAEQLNEVEGYGNSPDVIYPEELELKHREDQMKAERALARAMGQQQYAGGTSNVGSDIFKNAQRMQGGMQVVNRLGYDPSKPTYGFGSGEPTRRGIDIGVSGAANVFLPGFGWVAGKIARGLWHTIQNMQMRGASKQDIQQVVQQAQQQQEEQPEVPAAPTTAPPTTPATPSAGVGIDPWGNPADPGEWWSSDFGRWITDQYGTTPGNYNLQGPGGQFGTRGLNFSAQSNIGGSGTVGNFATAIGFDGPFGGGISAGDTSRFRGQAGYSHPYTEAQYNTPVSHFGWGGGPNYQGLQGATPRASYEQYLAGFHAPGTVGSSTGPGGAAVGGTGGPQGGFKANYGHTPKLSAAQTGTSDVGLKIFKRQQKLQGGTEAVPSELPTPPEPPEAYQSSVVRSLIDQVRQGILPDEALDEIKRDPTSARALVAMAGAALSAGTLLSGGRGGKIPKGEEPLIFGHTFEQIKSAQQGGRLEDPLRGPATKPSATDADRALLEKHGLEGLQEKGLFGVLDRLGLPTSKEPPQQHFMGTSSVNPGLKLFHAQQKRKK